MDTHEQSRHEEIVLAKFETLSSQNVQPSQPEEHLGEQVLGYLEVQPTELGVDQENATIFAQEIEIDGQHLYLTQGEGGNEIIVVVSADQDNPSEQAVSHFSQSAILSADSLQDVEKTRTLIVGNGQAELISDKFAGSSIDISGHLLSENEQRELQNQSAIINNSGESDNLGTEIPTSSVWSVPTCKVAEDKDDGTEMLFIPTQGVLSSNVNIPSTLLISPSDAKNRRLMQLACIAQELQSANPPQNISEIPDLELGVTSVIKSTSTISASISQQDQHVLNINNNVVKSSSSESEMFIRESESTTYDSCLNNVTVDQKLTVAPEMGHNLIENETSVIRISPSLDKLNKNISKGDVVSLPVGDADSENTENHSVHVLHSEIAHSMHNSSVINEKGTGDAPLNINKTVICSSERNFENNSNLLLQNNRLNTIMENCSTTGDFEDENPIDLKTTPAFAKNDEIVDTEDEIKSLENNSIIDVDDEVNARSRKSAHSVSSSCESDQNVGEDVSNAKNNQMKTAPDVTIYDFKDSEDVLESDEACASNSDSVSEKMFENHDNIQHEEDDENTIEGNELKMSSTKEMHKHGEQVDDCIIEMSKNIVPDSDDLSEEPSSELQKGEEVLETYEISKCYVLDNTSCEDGNKSSLNESVASASKIKSKKVRFSIDSETKENCDKFTVSCSNSIDLELTKHFEKPLEKVLNESETSEIIEGEKQQHLKESNNEKNENQENLQAVVEKNSELQQTDHQNEKSADKSVSAFEKQTKDEINSETSFPAVSVSVVETIIQPPKKTYERKKKITNVTSVIDDTKEINNSNDEIELFSCADLNEFNSEAQGKENSKKKAVLKNENQTPRRSMPRRKSQKDISEVKTTFDSDHTVPAHQSLSAKVTTNVTPIIHSALKRSNSSTGSTGQKKRVRIVVDGDDDNDDDVKPLETDTPKTHGRLSYSKRVLDSNKSAATNLTENTFTEKRKRGRPKSLENQEASSSWERLVHSSPIKKCNSNFLSQIKRKQTKIYKEQLLSDSLPSTSRENMSLTPVRKRGRPKRCASYSDPTSCRFYNRETQPASNGKTFDIRVRCQPNTPVTKITTYTCPNCKYQCSRLGNLQLHYKYVCSTDTSCVFDWGLDDMDRRQRIRGETSDDSSNRTDHQASTESSDLVRSLFRSRSKNLKNKEDSAPETEENELTFMEDDIVWVEWKRLYWPSVVRRLYQNGARISVMLIDSPNGKSGLKVSIKKVHPFNDPEQNKKFMNEGTKSSYCEAFTNAVNKAEEFLRQKSEGIDINASQFFDNTFSDNSESDGNGETEESAISNGEFSFEEYSFDVHRGSKDNLTEEEKERREKIKKAVGQEILNTLKDPEITEHLLGIHNNTIESSRHKKFFSDDPVEKNQLKSQTWFGPVKDHDQQGKIFDFCYELFSENCQQDEEPHVVSYVYEVWIPETIVKAISIIASVPMEEAEQLFEME